MQNLSWPNQDLDKTTRLPLDDYLDWIEFLPYALVPVAALGLGMVAHDLTHQPNSTNNVQKNVAHIVNHTHEMEALFTRLLPEGIDTYSCPVFSSKPEYNHATIYLTRDSKWQVKTVIINSDGKKLPIDYKVITDSLYLMKKAEEGHKK